MVGSPCRYSYLAVVPDYVTDVPTLYLYEFLIKSVEKSQPLTTLPAQPMLVSVEEPDVWVGSYLVHDGIVEIT